MRKWLIVLFIVGSLHAITLEEATKQALEHNPSLKANESAYHSAWWSSVNAFTDFLPKAKLNANYLDYGDLQRNNEYTYDKNMSIEVTQPIFLGGKVVLPALIMNDAKRIAKQSLQSERNKTISETHSKYYSVLEAKDLLLSAETVLAAAKESYKIAEVRFSVGQMAKADFLQIKADMLRKELNCLQLKNALKTSQLAFGNYLGRGGLVDADSLLLTAYQWEIGQIADWDLNLSEDKLQKILLLGKEMNPTLSIAKLNSEASHKTFLMAVGSFLPTVNLTFSKDYSYNKQNNYDDTQTTMLTASIPIFPLLDNYSEAAKSRYDYKKTVYTAKETENEIELSLQSVFYNLVTQAQSVYAAKVSWEAAQESFLQARERFEKGVIGTTDYLSIQTTYQSAADSYTKSIYDYLRQKASLANLIGYDNPQTLNQLILSEER